MDLWRILKRKIAKNGYFIPNRMVQLLPRGKKVRKKKEKARGGDPFFI
jgi:ribosomal protein S21